LPQPQAADECHKIQFDSPKRAFLDLGRLQVLTDAVDISLCSKLMNDKRDDLRHYSLIYRVRLLGGECKGKSIVAAFFHKFDNRVLCRRLAIRWNSVLRFVYHDPGSR